MEKEEGRTSNENDSTTRVVTLVIAKGKGVEIQGMECLAGSTFTPGELFGTCFELVFWY